MQTGRGLLIASLVAALLAVFTRTFVVEAVRIPSDSMAPALVEGDHLLVNRFIYAAAHGPRALPLPLPARDLRRGDVAVFRSPRGVLVIKRCLGLPGETVEVRDHRLTVDGAPLDESGYLNAPLRAGAAGEELAFSGPLSIPDAHYFCLGDHRDRSLDSRSWGPISAHRLRGRAFLIYWSIRPGPRDVARVTSWVKMAARWWSRCRWERSFEIVR